MWTEADVAGAVNAHPDIAADTLAALQLSDDMPRLGPAGMGVRAARHGGDVGKAWVEVLKAFDTLVLFAGGLAARGIAIDLTQPELAAAPDPAEPADAEDVLDDDDDNAAAGGGAPADFLDFAQRVMAFQCRIKTGPARTEAGSGTLIGPSSVLTAWHVIAAPGTEPGDDDVLESEIEVEFLNGLKVKAWQPPLVSSRCTRPEFAGVLPPDDTALAGHSDYAVLKLARPVGALLGVAALPPEPSKFKRRAGVLVIHYPGGVNPKVSVGSMTKIGDLTQRWGHTAKTTAGSSGGGCFDGQSYQIAGIHQGRAPPQARPPSSDVLLPPPKLVPWSPAIWRRPGCGRSMVRRRANSSSAARGSSKHLARCARKRAGCAVSGPSGLDPAADLSGLPFTFRILERLVARDPSTRLCRLSFESMVEDFAADVARRVTDAGVAVGAVAPRAGVAIGQSAPEAVGADRGRRIASAVGAAAEALGVQLWLFIDHPAIAFGDETGAALEAFVDQALRELNLRVVIAGYETATMPGLIFNEAIQPPGDGVGLINDFIGNFAGSDVEVFIRNAAEAANHPLSSERIAELVEDALDGLEHISQTYRPWLAATVGERLRPAVRMLFP